MLKKYFLLIAISIFGTNLSSQTNQIVFENSDFATALQKAKTENKLVFIDFKTEWCGPCKRLAAEVFTNDSVAAFYNASFVNLQIDAEKGEGIALAKRYQINSYPTLLIVDDNGKLIHRTSGFNTSKYYFDFGNDAFKPEKTYAYLDSLYTNNFSESNIIKHLQLRQSASVSKADILHRYFKTQSDVEMLSSKNWQIIRDYIFDSDEDAFLFLLTNEKEYAKRYTKEAVREKIYDVFDYEFQDNSENEKEYLSKVSKLKFLSKDYVLFHLYMMYYSNKDGKKLVELAVKKGEKYNHTPFHYSTYAASIIKHSNNKLALEKAEKWLKVFFSKWESKAYADDYFYYAKVSYKLGKNKQANVAANKVLQILKQKNIDITDYIDKADFKLLMKLANKN